MLNCRSFSSNIKGQILWRVNYHSGSPVAQQKQLINSCVFKDYHLISIFLYSIYVAQDWIQELDMGTDSSIKFFKFKIFGYITGLKVE
jgi:hypothetical protein